MLTRFDLKLLRTAARQRRDIEPAAKKRAVAAVQKILDNPETSHARRQYALQAMAAFRVAGWVNSETPFKCSHSLPFASDIATKRIRSTESPQVSKQFESN